MDFWSILIGVLFLLCMAISPLVIYLTSWHFMQRIEGPEYTFADFMEAVHRAEIEYPTPRLPFF